MLDPRNASEHEAEPRTQFEAAWDENLSNWYKNQALQIGIHELALGTNGLDLKLHWEMLLKSPI